MDTMILAVLVSASSMFYEAQVPSFGCNSGAEVAKLQSVRSDAHAFQKLLAEHVLYGQCVTIPQGAVVEGSIADTGSSTLLINAKSDPPGYVVPSRDFRAQKARRAPVRSWKRRKINRLLHADASPPASADPVNEVCPCGVMVIVFFRDLR